MRLQRRGRKCNDHAGKCIEHAGVAVQPIPHAMRRHGPLEHLKSMRASIVRSRQLQVSAEQKRRLRRRSR